jgi:hypothetical protein
MDNQTTMTKEKLQTAKEEALRFLKAVDALEDQKEVSTIHAPAYYRGSKQTGAVKRASMDLTRALAELRKPD